MGTALQGFTMWLRPWADPVFAMLIASAAFALSGPGPLLADTEPAAVEELKEVAPEDQVIAPGDRVIVRSDLAGAYFISKSLKEKYDALRRQLERLRTDITEARIDEVQARREIERLRTALDEALRLIERSQIYVPGATIHRKTESHTFPLREDELLLVEADNLRIVGWDEPGARCIIEKTVLTVEEDEDVNAEFAGIGFVHERLSGEAFSVEHDWFEEARMLRDGIARSSFEGFLGQDVTLVSLKGLTVREGNSQFSMTLRAERGPVQKRLEFRRHATMSLFVPKCAKVGIRGALGGLSVESLKSPLVVRGEGDRTYEATYEVRNLEGTLHAERIPLHLVEGVNGDVSVKATDYSENASTRYRPRFRIEPYGPSDCVYKEIQGSLTGFFCRANLHLENIAGQITVANEFGRTLLIARTPLLSARHRLFSQSGPIEVRLASNALGELGLALFTECGTVESERHNRSLEPRYFSTDDPNGNWRSWKALVTKNPERPFLMLLSSPNPYASESESGVEVKPLPPRLEIISRAGAVKLIDLDDVPK